ncbi:MAG: ATP-dependent RecD-like DNA helicase [Proteobacteria bacterium]|nr:ATP-dependent RecD-like DNA helicase [Pseudomonadota bacterium]
MMSLFPDAELAAASETAPGEVEGVVDRVVFHDATKPFTIVRVMLRSGQMTSVVGPIDLPRLATCYRFVGEWTTHRDYGRQLKACWYEEVLPNSTAGVEKYLASGLVRGLGKGLARRIARHFGAEALNVIDAEPERLLEIPRLSEEVRARLVRALEERRATRRVMTWLASHDVPMHVAGKIMRVYGARTIEVVQKSPYRMAEEVFGVSFKTADMVARRLGVAADDPFRLRAGVQYALKSAEDEGHMFLPREVLDKKAAELLESSPEALAAPIESASLAGRVIIDDDRVYLRRCYNLETRISEQLAARLETSGREAPDEGRLAEIERSLGGIELAALQRECLRRSLEAGVFIMTGGPGTGKTTTVRSILAWCEMQGLKAELAAPTGRASRRLSEASGADARTLHRLLEYVPAEHAFMRDSTRPLEADVVIVDEASMIDAWLFAALLDALRPETHLVLVGDVDQLPSVGAGCVLRDLIASERLPVVFLNEIFRQGEGSWIIRNSHRINRGELPEKAPRPEESDFFFIERDTPEEVADLILSLCSTRLPGHYGFNPVTDVQVISPMYKGEAGVLSLNAALQAKLNPPVVDGAPEVSVSNGKARTGDKVMQMRNNYDKGVFNGDMGIIEAIDAESRSLIFRLLGPASDPVTYTFDEAGELSLAYACSVHKSQGSEFQAAVVPVTTQHYVMLQRNLLYTAVTRARRLVVLVGSRRALRVAVENDKVEKRYTWLAERLKEIAAG